MTEFGPVASAWERWGRAPGRASALEEGARIATHHQIHLVLADPTLAQRREHVLDDMEVMPVRRHLWEQLWREPVREALGILGEDHLVGVAALAHRDNRVHPILEGQENVESEPV